MGKKKDGGLQTVPIHLQTPDRAGKPYADIYAGDDPEEWFLPILRVPQFAILDDALRDKVEQLAADIFLLTTATTINCPWPMSSPCS